MNNVMRYLAIPVLLGLSTGVALADKTYNVTLGSASKIGNVEFKPGTYRLVVDSPKVRFTEVKSGTEIELEAKVDEGDTKFNNTSVHLRNIDGVDQILEIRIGGSRIRIAFD